MTTPGADDRDDELEAILDAKEAREKAAKEAAAAKGAAATPAAKDAAPKSSATPSPSAASSSKASASADAPKSKTTGDVPKSKALAKPAGPPDRLARITLIVAAVLALVAAGAAPFQLAFIAETKVKGALVAFFAALSLLLSLRALLLRRKAPLSVGPALIAVVAASLSLTAAGFLAFQERSAAVESPEGAKPLAADRRAWELSRGQQRSRDLAVSGGLAIPGFALGALALGLGIGARRKAGAELEKDAADPKAAKGKRRKMVAAGWSALLLGSAIFAAGAAVDGLAILAPVEASAHPHVADLAKVRETQKTDPKASCELLETVLADQTPMEIVRAELPDVEEIAHRCTTDAIARLPKGMACVQKAATLGSSETTKLVHAEDRVKAACERALTE